MTEVTSFSPGRGALQSGAAGDDPDRGDIARQDPGHCNVILTTDTALSSSPVQTKASWLLELQDQIHVELMPF